MTSSGPGEGPDENGTTPADGESTTQGTTTTGETTTEENTTDGNTTASGSDDGLPGSQFDGFENLDRWYVLNQRGSLAGAGDAYKGPQSMHLKSGGKYVGAFKAFSSPKDMSGKNLSLAVKVNKPQVWKLTVELLAPDRGNKVEMTRTMPGPVDTWVRMDMGVTREVRNPDLSSVQEIRIIARDRGNNRPLDLFVDDLRLIDRPDQSYVMLSFDDVWKSHYTTALPMMQERGFKGVEGVVSDAVYGENRLDVGMMRKMRDAGWDMASRPRSTQYLTELSPEEQRRKIERNKQFLDRKGFQDGARHFLTPSRRRGPKTMEIVREFHDTMFTFGGAPTGLPSTTRYNYSRINTANSPGVKQLIDLTAKYNQLLVCRTKDIGNADGAISKKNFEAVLDYVKKADVKVVTASDLLEMQS